MSEFAAELAKRKESLLLFVASTAIAFLMFVQLQDDLLPDKEREFEAVIEFQNLSGDLIVTQRPERITLLASGSQRALDDLDTARVKAVVDMSQAEAGVARYDVTVDGPISRGVMVIPTRNVIDLGVEVLEHKPFEVNVQAAGMVSDVFEYRGVAAEPSTVTVNAAASIMPSVKSVRAIVDLTDALPNTTYTVRLEPLGEGDQPLAGVTVEPAEVVVRPVLSVAPQIRNLLVVPKFVNSPSGTSTVKSYTIEPTQIEVRGEGDTISRLRMIETEDVDLSGLSSNQTFTVGIRLPEGVESDTETVQVTVELED